MALSTALLELVEKLGEKGLLQEAKAIDPTIKAIEEIGPAILSKIRAPKAGTRAALPPAEPSADEVAKFGASVDQGSDVAPSYREPLKNVIPQAAETTGPVPINYPPYPGSGDDLSNIRHVSGEAIPKEAEVFSDMSQANQSPKGLSKAVKVGAGGAATLTGADYLSSMPEEVATGVDSKPSLASKIESAKTSLAATPPPPAAPTTPSSLAKQMKAPGPLRLDATSFDDPEYKKAVESFKEAQANATSEYASAKERTDWGRVASLLGEGLVKYGAARQGLKSNVDLSKIDIKTPDWHQMLQEDKDKYTMSTEGATKNAALAKGLSDERRGTFEKAQSIGNLEKTKNYETEVGNYSQASKFAQEEAMRKADQEAAQKRTETMVEGRAAVAAMKPNSVDAKILKGQTDAYGKATGALTRLAMDPNDKLAAQIFDAQATIAGIPEADRKQMKDQASTGKLKNMFTGDKDAASVYMERFNPVTRQAQPAAAPAGGTVSVLHVPTGQTKVYQVNDPKLPSVLSNPDFVQQ